MKKFPYTSFGCTSVLQQQRWFRVNGSYQIFLIADDKKRYKKQTSLNGHHENTNYRPTYDEGCRINNNNGYRMLLLLTEVHRKR